MPSRKHYRTYSELEKEISKGKIERVYFIAADDNFFLNRTAGLLLKKISGSEDNKENFFVKYADEISKDELFDLCTNFSSLFSAQKIVIVRRCEKFGRKLQDVIDFSYSIGDDTTVVLAFNKEYIEEKKLNKTLSFYDFTELPEEELVKWVRAEFQEKGCSINDDNIELFISLVPMNFDIMVNEIEKICGYLNGSKTEVDKQVLLKITGYDTEFTPYELISSIIKKDRLKAMEVLDYLLNRAGTSEIYIISLITNYLMDLMAYHNEDFKGKNPGEIFRDYKLWGDRIIFVQNHRNYGKNRNYEFAFERLMRTDQSLKNSMLDPKALITSLVLDLMNI